MPPFPYRGLLIYVRFSRVTSCAWVAAATIEDPRTAETAPVALPDVHPSPRAAGLQVIAVACARIRRGTWRN